ncbi:hypothetical protein ACKKBF_B15585 [Auxenochlorella protothecoides x Auxenochlorella symbiontica]
MVTHSKVVAGAFGSGSTPPRTLHQSVLSYELHRVSQARCGVARSLLQRPRPSRTRAGPSSSIQPLTLAMVNVDVSPAVILGVGLIGSGLTLWQIRQAKPWISKDYDVVISCVALLVGGILIFQGWRLDPLLLFGQLMTTGAALSFGVEALRLRSAVYEKEEAAEMSDMYDRRNAGPRQAVPLARLPPPEPSRPFWEGEAPRRYGDEPEAQQEVGSQGEGYYSPGEWYYGKQDVNADTPSWEERQQQQPRETPTRQPTPRGIFDSADDW